MVDLDVWLEGIAQPVTLRFHDYPTARNMAGRIGQAAVAQDVSSAPFADDTGHELWFVLSTLRAIHLRRDV